jgi:hypothetical protein
MLSDWLSIFYYIMCVFFKKDMTNHHNKYSLHPEIFLPFDFYIKFDHSSSLKKVMEKIKYILKLHYVINYIIFDFFITLFFNKTNDQS